MERFALPSRTSDLCLFHPFSWSILIETDGHAQFFVGNHSVCWSGTNQNTPKTPKTRNMNTHSWLGNSVRCSVAGSPCNREYLLGIYEHHISVGQRQCSHWKRITLQALGVISEEWFSGSVLRGAATAPRCYSLFLHCPLSNVYSPECCSHRRGMISP